MNYTLSIVISVCIASLFYLRLIWNDVILYVADSFANIMKVGGFY